MSEVIERACGTCSKGRAATANWLSRLSTVPSLRKRRRIFAHFLRTFEGAKQHGNGWRVTGREAFVGKQHYPAELRERFDAETGDVEHKIVRPHYPGASAGGLAALEHRSPRTLNGYRQWLRASGAMGSAQPPAKARDAQRAPDGKWAYAQHWVREVTPEMVRRWKLRGRKAKVFGRPPRPERRFSAAQLPRVGEWADLRTLADTEKTRN